MSFSFATIARSGVVAAALCCAAFPGLAQPRFDAVVDPARAGTSVEGAPVYAAIADALAAAPVDGAKPFVIRLDNGRLREKVIVDKPNVALIGESRDGAVLTFDAYNGLKKADGTTWGTGGSATLTVRARDFRAENLTIENGFDFLGNDARGNTDPNYTSGSQAVAVYVDQGSDRSRFHNVTMLGYQDTLFVNVGRTYVTDSLIAGNVDFIFGAGTALFERCEIRARPRGDVSKLPVGHVTAPSTSIKNPAGLVFRDSRLTREAGVPVGSMTLGRPWHPTTTFPDGRYADPEAIGNSVYINVWMDDHISPDGWDKMQGTGKEAGTKTWFLPEDSRFFEHRSGGPGAIASPSRRALTDEAAAAFTAEKVLGDWKP